MYIILINYHNRNKFNKMLNEDWLMVQYEHECTQE
jgi:hypothetical protein